MNKLAVVSHYYIFACSEIHVDLDPRSTSEKHCNDFTGHDAGKPRGRSANSTIPISSLDPYCQTLLRQSPRDSASFSMTLNQFYPAQRVVT